MERIARSRPSGGVHPLSSLTFMLPSGTVIDTADPGADVLLRRRGTSMPSVSTSARSRSGNELDRSDQGTKRGVETRMVAASHHSARDSMTFEPVGIRQGAE